MTDAVDKAPRLLALLEGDCLPTLRGRSLLKRGPELPGALLRAVRVPTWNWRYRAADWRDRWDAETVLLDANAAYLSSAASCRVSLNGLTHTGPLTEYNRYPGYYQLGVDPGAWQDMRLMSPLGQAVHRDMVWLAEPTVTLLSELARVGDWPEFEIHDSWTDTAKVPLTRWTDELRDMRAVLIESGDRAGYDAFKIAYSQAIQMLRGDDKTIMRRADMNDAVRAQHNANIWRKAWNCVKAGHGPLASGRVDALTFRKDDVMALSSLMPPPIRLDQQDLTFGTFKIVPPDSE